MNKLKFVVAVALVLSLTACGYAARDTELVGQVKKVQNRTPLICPDYTVADVSLGVMRNGVGSMSTQDMWVVVDAEQAKVLKKAAEDGSVVKVNYDTKRLAICSLTNHFAATVETIK